MSSEESSDVLLQKLDDHTGKNFARMFLDFNESGMSGTLTLEMLKGSSPFYSEYSEWRPFNDHSLAAFDATILSSASIKGAMRNSFLIKKFQVLQTQNMNGQPQKPGFFDGLGGLFGGNKGVQGGNDMARLGG